LFQILDLKPLINLDFFLNLYIIII